MIMKKLIAISVVFVFVAGVAFAQLADGISVNAWGRGAFAPLVIVGAEKDTKGDVVKDAAGKEDKADLYAGSGVTWGGPQTRVDFRLHGATDYVGFTIASHEGGLGAADDGYHIWVRPFGTDILKVTVGSFVNDTLRGKVGSVNGGFESFSLNGIKEEDPIFTRFGANDVGGPNSTNLPGTNAFMLSSSPVDGLFFGIMVPGQLWSWGGPASGTEAKESYRYMQIGAGYNIDGVGHIRAQWIGGYFGTEKKADDEKYVKFETDKPARVEAAFALTMVDGLLIDLGGKFWLPTKGQEDSFAVSNGVGVSLGANFRKEAFSIAARVDAESLGAYNRTGKDDKSADGMALDIRLTPTYDLDAATLGVDLGFQVNGAGKDGKGDSKKDSGFQIGFGGFVKKGLAGGYIKAGLTYTLAPFGETPDGMKSSGSGVFMIPVVLEYAFF